MKSTRLYLMIGVIVVALLGAYWAVRAQDGPLFGPPPVLPSENADKQVPAKQPHQTQPANDKKKADPTLIVPPEVYDVPRPIGPAIEARGGFVTEEQEGILQAQGVAAPPEFPPLSGSEPKADKSPTIVSPLPAVETSAPQPLPMIDPTRVLIAEPIAPDAAPTKAPVVELPLPPPIELKKDAMASKNPLVELPMLPPIELKKEAPANKNPIVELPPLSMPTHEMPPKKGPLVELPFPPPNVVLPPVAMPETKPPTVSLPSVTPEPLPSEKPRAFVRIKPDVSAAPLSVPPLDPRTLEHQRLDLDRNFPQPQPVVPPGTGLSGLVNLQTPSVTVEKRGVARLRRDKLETYQIVVRNLGPGLAQQVRIEDELPPNVKVVNAEPMPAIQGGKAVWLLSSVPFNQEQVFRFTLQADADTEITGRVSAHVAAMSQTTVTALRRSNDLAPLAIQVTGPTQVAIGKSAVFQVRVVNQSNQPLTGIILHGSLPDGLAMKVKDEGGMREEREIEGKVDVTIAPGDSKALEMPAHAVKPGRWTVAIKVTTQAGHEAAATASIEVTAETMQLQQASATRLYLGRDGDLRIDLTNHTSKPLRNVTVADRLPEGLDFVDANLRGLYQANSRIVYWVIDQLPAGKTQTLVVRVNGAKAGQHQNVVFAKADGVPEMQSSGVVTLEGLSELTMRVIERDNPLELGKETVYEIKVQNPGNLPASNVQLQVQFPPGLVPKNAQGKTRFSIDRQSVLFEPIASLDPQAELIFRVSALAQAPGDQRVRFAVASEQVRVPIQREISTRVYADKNP